MMNYYPFNSRNTLYKSRVGAIASNENLVLRLLLHKDAHVNSAILCIQKDCEELRKIELTPKEWLNDYRFYDTEITLDEGLYWYYFEYTSEYGNYFVIKEKNFNGIFSKEDGEHFQQTVYSKNFKMPKGFAGGIIYQIFPDRFNNSKTPKKNVPSDRFLFSEQDRIPQHLQRETPDTLGNDYFGGDLKGIEQKLDYLKSLGVTCIYLNPIFEAHSNHRYNTADYLKIDPLLGDESDFVSLCKKAKKKGISVIFDGVFSHTGDDSIYFNAKKRYGEGGAFNDINSKYRSWYNFNDSAIGYTAWWGVPSLPETNETNEDFSEFITGENGVIAHWLNAGADGIRLDVADELPDAFLEKLRLCVKSQKENAYILGEVWEDASNKISYGNRRKYLLGHQLDSVMNYKFYNGIVNFIKTGNAEELNNTVLTLCENYPPNCLNLMMNHLGTHDTARILTVLSNDFNSFYDRNWQAEQKLTQENYEFAKRRLKTAAVLQYTLPGIPSIFYGDEAGLEGYGDPFCRKVYPFGNEDNELIEFYKALGKTRHFASALKCGEFEPITAENGIFSFIRKADKSSVFVAVNAGKEETEINILPEYYDCKIKFGKQSEGNTLNLKEYEYLIYVKEP